MECGVLLTNLCLLLWEEIRWLRKCQRETVCVFFFFLAYNVAKKSCFSEFSVLVVLLRVCWVCMIETRVTILLVCVSWL